MTENPAEKGIKVKGKDGKDVTFVVSPCFKESVEKAKEDEYPKYENVTIKAKLVTYLYCGHPLCQIRLPNELISQNSFELSQIPDFEKQGFLKRFSEDERRIEKERIKKGMLDILNGLLQSDSEILHGVSWKSMTIGEAHEVEKFYQGQAEGYNAFYRKAMEFLKE